MSEFDAALPFISEDEFVNLIVTSPFAMLSGDLPSAEEQKWKKVGRSATIFVTQVSSPYKFWFQTATALSDLKDLMKSLSLTYQNCNVEKFKIPQSCVRVGLICAAIFQDQWHRAKIVEVIDDTEVTVHYVDYGTTCSVSIHHLLYLHQHFADYPAQAIRGCLDLVRPTGGTWTYDSCKHFARISLHRKIYAKITSLNESENIVYMKMRQMPKNGEEDLLASSMIEAKHAYAVNDSVNAAKPRIYCESYPTFYMLEWGMYPSMQNIKKWKKKGFDFHEYDHSIAHQLKFA